MDNNGGKLSIIEVKNDNFHEQLDKKIKDEELRKRSARARRLKKKRRKKLIIIFIMLLIIIAGIYAIITMVKGNNNTTKEQPTEDEEVKSENIDIELISLDEEDYIYDCDEEILEKLRIKSETDDKIKFVYDNYRAFPEYLLKSLSNNSELINFVLKYPEEINNEHSSFVNVLGDYVVGEIPHFVQWDDRWGYYPYGDDIMGISGCGPTSLSMVMVALTGKAQYTPVAIADFATDNGYYYEGKGTTWELFNTGVTMLGLKVRTIGLSEESMISAINNGEYLILSMGPGIFTTQGHYIVIYGYENGAFLIKDPNSIIRTNTVFKFSEISDQIKNIWALSK